MVAIAEVRDRESLQAYLEGLEGDAGLLTARRVAFRAAARVLPLALKWYLSEDAKKLDVTAVPVLSALAFGGVASTWPTPPTKAETAAAVTVAATSVNAAANSARSVSADNESANVAAVNIAAAAAAVNHADAAFAAASTAAATAFAAAEVWDAIRIDLDTSEDDPTLTMPALWQSLEEPKALTTAWSESEQSMKEDTAADWSFWIHWYERVRAGRDFHADRLAEILNPLREDDWRKGPGHINPLFDDLLALYREEDAELEALRNEAGALLAERPTTTTIASLAQRSHNMPPELVDVETKVLRNTEIIWNDIAEAKRELDEPNPDKSRLRAQGNRVWN